MMRTVPQAGFHLRRGAGSGVFGLALLATVCSCEGQQSAPAGPAASTYKKDIEPILSDYCFDCHGDGSAKGKVSLDEFDSLEAHLGNLPLWERAYQNIRTHLMPPADEDFQPDPDERAAVLRWIEASVFKLDPDNPDPGRVTIRRMNREEYRNTIRDLLDVDFAVNDSFPADDTGYGFDTIGDVLTISPLLLEKYLAAAGQIAAMALPRDAGTPPPLRIKPGDVREPGKRSQTGRYPESHRRILFKGLPPRDEGQQGAYMREIVERFATRAFRRPVDRPTVDRLTGMGMARTRDEGMAFVDGVEFAVTAILSSPRFLFRSEIQAEPDNPGKVVPVDEYALASRLSYFLWSSAPDEQLMQLAGKGALRAQLREQVDRMLEDPKAQRLVRNFTGQWLQARDLEGLDIDTRRILGERDRRAANRIFNQETRRDMRRETELFFAHVLLEDRPALELLTANYSFLNERLAKFYGVPEVRGDAFRRVEFGADTMARGGILAQGTFLVVTSNPTRTSPVKRGLFVLDSILASPTPPPPPDVPELEEARKQLGKNPTVGEMLAVHRAEPLCKSCHVRMDPIGLALENFNALGQWREREEGRPIDSSGKLVTGEEFANVMELKEILATSRRQDFHRCLTEKLLTYALGRGVEYYDAPSVDKIVRELGAGGGTLRELLHGIVASPPFQMRRGDGKRLGRN